MDDQQSPQGPSPAVDRPLPGSRLRQKRQYRSKKVIPCDLCRTRKVACVVDDGSSACSFCHKRGLTCTFLSQPGVKSRPGYQPARRRSHDDGYIALRMRVLGQQGPASRPLTPTGPADPAGRWFNQAMAMEGHTCFYAGMSGDHSPDLLRHLSFNDQNIFGDASWSVWRVHPRIHNPVYFTIFPESSLDAHYDMYANAKITRLLGPYIPGLIDLYYTYVHPSYPILEPQEELLQRRQAGKVRISLMSCVCLPAMDFWPQSASLSRQPAPTCPELWNDIFVALTVETRTPNLDTVKGLLLYMQLPSHFVKEPNRPGQWALSSLLAGVAQDIGLHVDPSDWRIPLAERKSRRILWWAVYAHDKWTAHFLGRHPHLRAAHCDVRPLAVDDFSDDTERIHLGSLTMARVFVAFAQLSVILEYVLEAFYAAPGQHHDPAAWFAVARGIMEKLARWKDKIGFLGEDLPESPSLSSLRIACHTIELSIWRAALGQPQQPWEKTGHSMVQTTEQIQQILATLPQSKANGFWLSYCTGNLEIVGSVLLRMCLSSTDERMFDEHMRVLLEFRSHLQRMSEAKAAMYETGRLPLVRLNLILDRLSQRQSEF